MLQSMGLQRLGYDWATEQQQNHYIYHKYLDAQQEMSPFPLLVYKILSAIFKVHVKTCWNFYQNQREFIIHQETEGILLLTGIPIHEYCI